MDHYILDIDVQVSLVITLIDAYTGEPPQGLTTVYLENMFRKPVKKPDGHFVFTDLPASSYKVSIKAEYYLDESFEITTSSKEDYPHVYVSLKPRAHYPFKEGATTLRASVRDAGGYPQEVKVVATVQSEDAFLARLAEQSKEGSASLTLAQVRGKIAIGDRLLIRNKQKEKVELCTIREHEYGTREYLLEEALHHEHPRGTLLLPVVETRSDERGEIVIPFRSYGVKHFTINLSFVSTEGEMLKEVSVQEGMMDYLGMIQL